MIDFIMAMPGTPFKGFCLCVFSFNFWDLRCDSLAIAHSTINLRYYGMVQHIEKNISKFGKESIYWIKASNCETCFLYYCSLLKFRLLNTQTKETWI